MFELLPAALCLLLSVLAVWAAEKHEVAAPRDAHVHSLNLRNTARWSPGTGDTHGITYTVEYAIYGDAVVVDGTEQVVWRPVERCSDIVQTECDMTEQTGDMEDEYYIRVRANGPNGRSRWTETNRRLRLSDTVLGPPQLNVSIAENKLSIKLSGPFRWRTPGRKRQSMMNIFPHLIYNVSVYNNRTKYMAYFLQLNKLLHHGPLEYNTEYCMMAEVLSRSLHLTTTPSDWVCVSTPTDPVKTRMLLMMLAVIIPTAVCLFVLATVCGFAYYYICGHKPRLPSSMDIQHDTHKEMKVQLCDQEKYPNIHLIVINISDPSKGEKGPMFLQHGGPPTGVPYKSQILGHTPPPPPPSSSSSVAGVQSTVSLSDDYGLVHAGNETQGALCPYNPQVVVPYRCGVSVYVGQSGPIEQATERYEEEIEADETENEIETQTIFNWDQENGRLQLDFPLFSRFSEESSEVQMRENVELLSHHPVLTSVVVKQASEDIGDDDPLLQIEKDWDLQIQSSTD